MKSQNGITLLGLTVYVIVFTIVLGAMSYVTVSFYNGTSDIQEQGSHASEFNKLNVFLVSDAKHNKTAIIEEHKIEFEDGTIYEYKENEKNIYRNNNIIARNISSIAFDSSETTTNNTKKQIIQVDLKIGEQNSFTKKMRYVLKYW